MRAHLNSAVTLVFTVGRHFPAKKAPGCLVSQLFGAFAGAAMYILAPIIGALIGEPVRGPSQNGRSRPRRNH